MEVTSVERSNPELLHSKAGSVIAREKYDIEDEDILEAIRWHTTGKPEMSLLESIIFVADYIEPNRHDNPHLDSIRQMAFTDIDIAIAMICRNSILYLKRKDRQIDRITYDTYEYYKENSNYVE